MTGLKADRPDRPSRKHILIRPVQSIAPPAPILLCYSLLLGSSDEVVPGRSRTQGPVSPCRQAVGLPERRPGRHRYDLGPLLSRHYARQLLPRRRQLLRRYHRTDAALPDLGVSTLLHARIRRLRAAIALHAC